MYGGGKMNINLLYEDKDTSGDYGYAFKNDIVKDLRLDVLFREMAKGDGFIASVARNVVLKPLTKKGEIRYRQDIMMDAIKHPNGFIEFYQETLEAKEDIEKIRIDEEQVNRKGSKAMKIGQTLEGLSVLIRHIEQLKVLVGMFESEFISRGMTSFCERFNEEFNEHTVIEMRKALEEMTSLTDGGEITFSGVIGDGMKGTNFVVNKIRKIEKKEKIGLMKELYYKMFKHNVTLLRTQKMIEDATQMEQAGLYHILKIYENFVKELYDFFDKLRYQIAFYVGALNLYNRTVQYHTEVCMPKIAEENRFEQKGLYDFVLAIDFRRNPVCNDLNLSDKDLLIITGANQGGKSTFLRSIGIAQVLMQAGLFVPAKSYCSRCFEDIFTHFARREDASMNSGKLEEELIRMNHIIDEATKKSLILLNEPFATTTEMEGSGIASDITRALYDAHICVFIVTHLYEYSKSMYEKKLERAYFLGAERLEDGTRTYRMVEHEPKETSYGIDLFERVIGV